MYSKFIPFLFVFGIISLSNAQINTWSELSPSTFSPNNYIQSIAIDNLGNIYAGGLFTDANSKKYVSKWNGTSWGELGSGTNALNANNYIWSIATDKSGNVYAAGRFTDGSAKEYVAKWNGTTWSELGTGANSINVSGYIQTIAVDDSGNVYAAGTFTDANVKRYVAKWDGTTWSELGTGANALNANNYIESIAIDKAGNIYAAGAFTDANGKGYVAKWNGTTWSELGIGINALNANNYIWSIAVDSLDNVYAGGAFLNSNNLYYVAQWNGTTWSELGAGSNALNGNNQILSIDVDASGNVYAGGAFTDANGYEYIAKWNGTRWSELGSSLAYTETNYINSVIVDDSGNVYAGGIFKDYQGRYYVAKWTNTPIPSTKNIEYCQGATATALAASPVSGGTLNWYTTNIGGVANSTAPVPSTSTVGSTVYYVSQTLNGYESLRSRIEVTVNSLPVAPTSTNSLNYCLDAIATPLSATGSSLLWYTSPTHGSSSSSPPVPSTSTVGITSYYVSQTDNNNCESLRDTIAVRINPLPIASASSSAPTNFCQGSNVKLNANTGKGLSYQWLDSSKAITGAKSDNYIASLTGLFAVIVTDSNSCKDTSTTISVTVDSMPTTSIVGVDQYITTANTVIDGDIPTVGNGNWTVINGTGSFGDPLSPTTSVTGLDYGLNTFEWTISNGTCPSSSSMVNINVGNAPPPQSIIGEDIVVKGTKAVYAVTDNINFKYHWVVPSDAVIDSANSDSSAIVVIFGASSGDIIVKITDLYGSTMDTLAVTVTGITGIISNASTDNYTVYPNPFTGTATIIVNSSTKENISLVVIDSKGINIFSSSDYYTNSPILIGGQIPNPGIYFVLMSNGVSMKVIKLVKTE